MDLKEQSKIKEEVIEYSEKAGIFFTAPVEMTFARLRLWNDKVCWA